MAKRRRYGALTHRGASQYGKRSRIRHFNVRVVVERNVGAAHDRQFCAFARLPQRGSGRRFSTATRAHRTGQVVCGPTPTIAAKRALRVFVGSQWTR